MHESTIFSQTSAQVNYLGQNFKVFKVEKIIKTAVLKVTPIRGYIKRVKKIYLESRFNGARKSKPVI